MRFKNNHKSITGVIIAIGIFYSAIIFIRSKIIYLFPIICIKKRYETFTSSLGLMR